LNTYCMIYYRTLAHANALHFFAVLKYLRAAAAEAKEERGAIVMEEKFPIPSRPARRIFQALQLLFQHNISSANAVRNHQQQQPTQQQLDQTPLALHDFTDDEVEDNTENMELESPRDIIGGLLVSRNSLREGLMSIAPGSINSETAELVEHLVDSTKDMESISEREEDENAELFEESVEMAKCARYVLWHCVGKIFNL
jgi:ABC-type dipeptide/oligopeptide/nickel transport system ATPase subunit